MHSAEDLRGFDGPFEAIRAAVINVLREIRAKSVEWSYENQVVTARTPFGILSFVTCGEQITIAVDPSGEVWVYSESLNPRNWIDFGINRSNCRMILNEIGRQLART
jgi:hypothetical protein